MRRAFAKELVRRALADDRIWLVNADMGYKMWDEYISLVGDRYINVGAAEQVMLDVSVGLALSGKRPFAFTITPFFLRGFETIRTYIAHEQIPVVMVGSGRDKDYAHDGISHDASDFRRILDALDVRQYCPESKEEIPDLLTKVLADPHPAFVSLKR